MARGYQGGIGPGTLSAGIDDDDTTIPSARLAHLREIVAPEFDVGLIHASPGTPGPSNELVKITAHAPGATTATVERGFDGGDGPTTPAVWPAGSILLLSVLTADDVGAGGAVEVVHHEAAPTAGAFDISGLDLTAYAKVEIVLAGLTVSADDTDIRGQLYIDGVLFTTGTQRTGALGFMSDGASGNLTTAGSGTFFPIDDTAGWGIGSAAGESGSLEITLFAPGAATNKQMRVHATHQAPSAASSYYYGSAMVPATGEVTGFKFFGSGGTIASGTLTIYGYKTA